MNLGLYVDNITSRRTSCRRARAIARAYIRGGYGTKRVSGFRCREVRQGVELWDVRCTKPGGWVVRFQYGA